MTESANLLRMPAPAAACLIARRWLDRAAEVGRRFVASEDAEALHDFRVGLRRLRATERSYRRIFADSVPKKLRRALRDLAQASNVARDTEVQLAWLEAQKTALRPHQRSGWQWLHRHLQMRLLQEYAQLRDRVDSDFRSLEQRLRMRLQDGADVDQAPMAAVVEAALRGLLEEMIAAVAHLDDRREASAIHELRLVVKRIRYLLDPFADELEAAELAARDLARMQDLLGDIHDRQLMRQELFTAAEAAGAERFRALLQFALEEGAESPRLQHARRRGESAGLVALALMVAEQERDLLGRLSARIERGDLDALLEGVGAAIAAIADAVPAEVMSPAPDAQVSLPSST